jgi:hypothetical protein
VIASVVPGTGATPAASAMSRLAILSPIFAMAAGGGPIQFAPASITAAANAGSSARKPYPGCTASAPDRLTAAMIAATSR